MYKIYSKHNNYTCMIYVYIMHAYKIINISKLFCFYKFYNEKRFIKILF